MDENKVEIDPEKYIQQISEQRNAALNQAAQLACYVQQLEEQLQSLTKDSNGPATGTG